MADIGAAFAGWDSVWSGVRGADSSSLYQRGGVERGLCHFGHGRDVCRECAGPLTGIVLAIEMTGRGDLTLGMLVHENERAAPSKVETPGPIKGTTQ